MIAQGTIEWRDERRGKPSASDFSKLITATGKPSASAKGYVDKLIAERLIGWSDGYTSEAMQRGIDLEPLARVNYELITGDDVTESGFITDETDSYGCSPDGIIVLAGGSKGLEIKCPMPPAMASYLRDEQEGVKKYYQQIQGSMLVTGLKQWDFFAYHPEMPFVLVTVERDDDFCCKLQEQLLKAVKIINDEVEKLKCR
jgi:hypothetical protein|tara:strand:- start:224 stop:823 length:600 start_codon:yes stop_codon:yes gene_type:complete